MVPKVAWGTKVDVSSECKYLQVAENPSQNVICPFILFLLFHITTNPEIELMLVSLS
jgi:hypothetical protein